MFQTYTPPQAGLATQAQLQKIRPTQHINNERKQLQPVIKLNEAGDHASRPCGRLKMHPNRCPPMFQTYTPPQAGLATHAQLQQIRPTKYLNNTHIHIQRRAHTHTQPPTTPPPPHDHTHTHAHTLICPRAPTQHAHIHHTHAHFSFTHAHTAHTQRQAGVHAFPSRGLGQQEPSS